MGIFQRSQPHSSQPVNFIQTSALLVAVSFLAMSVLGCGGVPNPSWYLEAAPEKVANIPPDSTYSFSRYHYSMGDDERDRFCRNADSLKLGDKLDLVIQKLGDPDVSAIRSSALFPTLHNRYMLKYVLASDLSKPNGPKRPTIDIAFIFNSYRCLEEVDSEEYPRVRGRKTRRADDDTFAPQALTFLLKGDVLPRAYRRDPLAKPSTLP